MASIREIHNSWRDSLVPASFRGVPFHVESSKREGGRRHVLFEYPKSNRVFSEDMGRQATRFTFTAYVIHGDHGFGDVMAQIRALNTALDDDDAGMLVHPWLGQMLVICDKWSYSDSRTRGGYYEYDLTFVEAGSAGLSSFVDTGSQMQMNSNAAENQGVSNVNSGTSNLQKGGAGTLTGI
jgi:prophage DNA circulation protein